MKMLTKFIVICLMFVSITAFAQTSPTVMLQKTFDKFIAALNANHNAIKRNPKVANRLVRKYVLPKIDLTGMARSVVGRSVWVKATRSQKKRFVRAFTRLVLRTYERAFVQYTFEKVKVYNVRGGYKGKRRVLVHSTVFRKSASKVDLSYRLVQKRKGWRIYDLSVEGISLIQSYRSQFSAPIAKGGIEGLIKDINNMKRRS